MKRHLLLFVLLSVGCTDTPGDAARLITMPQFFHVAQQSRPLFSRTTVFVRRSSIGGGDSVRVWMSLSRPLVAGPSDLSALVRASYEYRAGGRSFNSSVPPSLALQREMRLPSTGTLSVISVLDRGRLFTLNVSTGSYVEPWIGITISPGRNLVAWHHRGASGADYHFEWSM